MVIFSIDFLGNFREKIRIKKVGMRLIRGFMCFFLYLGFYCFEFGFWN